MRKPIPYARQCIGRDDIDAVSRTLASDWLTQGPRVEEFERSVASWCGARYAVAVNSGTTALHIACLAAGIAPGDEAITSPITFVASSNCIAYCGAKPVFADIDEETVNIDPREFVRKLSKRTKAVIPVHFAGHPADLAAIRDAAAKRRLTVIEDAAHALGAEYRASKIGSCEYSDMTTLSFHAVKHITTGEGGMVLTNRKDLYDKLVMFRSHGITRDREKLCNKKPGSWYYEMQELGFNYRLTDIQSSLGMQQLKKLARFLKRRREIARMYSGLLRDVEGVTIPREHGDVVSSWHIYCIQVAGERDRIFDELRRRGVGVNVHYIPVHLQPYYRKRYGYRRGDYPAAERYYDRAITLPLFPSMTDRDVWYVVESVKKSVGEIS